MRYSRAAALAFVAFSLGACDVDQVEDGEMPDVDVDVESGEMPEYDVETADVDVDMETDTVVIERPDVDIDMPDDTIDMDTLPDDTLEYRLPSA